MSGGWRAIQWNLQIMDTVNDSAIFCIGVVLLLYGVYNYTSFVERFVLFQRGSTIITKVTIDIQSQGFKWCTSLYTSTLHVS